jgi:myo-inositol 2-dehydrogenase / D-chiro-inositol 1-dehydrogenase
LAEHKDLDTLMVGGIEAQRAAAVAEEVGRQCATIEEVLSSGLDAVAVTATTSAHAELINACLDEGPPTFCQEPVALGYEETVATVENENE